MVCANLPSRGWRVTEEPLVAMRVAGGVAYLTLNRAGRHNSLVPAFLEELLDCLGAIRSNTRINAVVLAAAGSSFSTGGDVREIQRQGSMIASYAERLVGLLNEAVLDLFDLRVPLIGRVQGPVTGGALGLVLACDLVAVTPRVFFAPYYVEVGFSPDGGWTALLPERIGSHRAGEIQLLNRHVGAVEAVALGIADCVVEDGALDAQIDLWLSSLQKKSGAGLQATKRLLLTPQRRARYAAALEEERKSFVTQVGSEEARRGMARFLDRRLAC